MTKEVTMETRRTCTPFYIQFLNEQKCSYTVEMVINVWVEVSEYSTCLCMDRRYRERRVNYRERLKQWMAEGNVIKTG